SQPLFVDNQFGAHLLADCTGENEPIKGSCCEYGKPRVLTMEYNGLDCGATSHMQDPGKVSCDDYGPLTDTVFILSTNKANPADSSAKVWFSGVVTLGQLYDIDAANAGLARLENATFVHVFDGEGGTLLQSTEFHTSCSQPLAVGDQYGASLLVDCLGEDQTAQALAFMPSDVGEDKPAEPVAADVTGDGMTDIEDLVAVVLAWGSCDPTESCPADLNGDRNVDVEDLLAVIQGWSL
ncbi:MAG: DUF7467 domain-containing protein, partial [Planctomycetota bacterium]